MRTPRHAPIRTACLPVAAVIEAHELFFFKPEQLKTTRLASSACRTPIIIKETLEPVLHAEIRRPIGISMPHAWGPDPSPSQQLDKVVIRHLPSLRISASRSSSLQS